MKRVSMKEWVHETSRKLQPGVYLLEKRGVPLYEIEVKVATSAPKVATIDVDKPDLSDKVTTSPDKVATKEDWGKCNFPTCKRPPVNKDYCQFHEDFLRDVDTDKCKVKDCIYAHAPNSDVCLKHQPPRKILGL